MAAAERAPEGQKKPVEGCFQGIPVAYTSEIDGSAMWAPWEQHTLQYLDQIGINEQQQPSIELSDSERWNQKPVSTFLPSLRADFKFEPRVALVRSVPLCKRFPPRDGSQGQFCAITFTHPHAPFGGKQIPRKKIRAMK